MNTMTTTPTKSLNAIQTAFLHLWTWITGTSVKLYEFLLPVLESEVSKTIEALAPLATEIVLSLATSGKTGAEKRNAAIDQLKTAAISAGITAGVDVLNTTVELALQNLKAGGRIAP